MAALVSNVTMVAFVTRVTIVDMVAVIIFVTVVAIAIVTHVTIVAFVTKVTIISVVDVVTFVTVVTDVVIHFLGTFVIKATNVPMVGYLCCHGYCGCQCSLFIAVVTLMHQKCFAVGKFPIFFRN
jgi:hypothetical protein